MSTIKQPRGSQSADVVEESVAYSSSYLEFGYSQFQAISARCKKL